MSSDGVDAPAQAATENAVGKKACNLMKNERNSFNVFLGLTNCEALAGGALRIRADLERLDDWSNIVLEREGTR